MEQRSGPVRRRDLRQTAWDEEDIDKNSSSAFLSSASSYKSIADNAPEARGLRCGVNRLAQLVSPTGVKRWRLCSSHWADRLLACWLG